MIIKIRLKHTSQPICFTHVVNAYQKGSFYCVYLNEGTVKKYPIVDIFNVEETYDKMPPSSNG